MTIGNASRYPSFLKLALLATWIGQLGGVERVLAGNVTLTVPTLTVPAPGCADLTISTSNLTGLHAPGFSFRVRYNPRHLRFSQVQAVGIALGYSISSTVDSIAGSMAVICWGLNDLSGSGAFCKLTFCNRTPTPVSNCDYLTCLDNAWVGDPNQVDVSYSCPHAPCTWTGTPGGLDTTGRLWVTPNPFATGVEIHVWPLLGTRAVKLEIFDVRGRLVRSMEPGEMESPSNSVLTWDGRDDGGTLVPAGAYWVRLRNGSFDQTVKLIRSR